MARRRKVGATDTTTIVLFGIGGIALLYLLMNSNKTATAPVVVRTPVPSPANNTAAEIAAGASVLNTALNDFSDDDDNS